MKKFRLAIVGTALVGVLSIDSIVLLQIKL